MKKLILGITLLLVLGGCANTNQWNLPKREIDRPLIVPYDKKLGEYAVGVTWTKARGSFENSIDEFWNFPRSEGETKYGILPSKLSFPIFYRYSMLPRFEFPMFVIPTGVKYLVTGEQSDKINNDINLTVFSNILLMTYSGTAGINYLGETGSEYKKKFDENIWLEGNNKIVYTNNRRDYNYSEFDLKNYIGQQFNDELSIRAGLHYINKTENQIVYVSGGSSSTNITYSYEEEVVRKIKSLYYSFILQQNINRNVLSLSVEVGNVETEKNSNIVKYKESKVNSYKRNELKIGATYSYLW